MASIAVTGKTRARVSAIGWPVKSTPRLKVKRFFEEQPVLDPEAARPGCTVAQLRDDRLARRAVAEERADGVARKGKDHEVDEQGGSEEDRNDLQQAPEDELDHSSASGEMVERKGNHGTASCRFKHMGARQGRTPKL